MKSKLVILSFMLAGAVVANAQTKEKFVSEKATDNIFVSVTGGISMVNSGKSEGKFGSPAPHITVSVGKWFTPVWGVRGQGGLWKTNFDTQWAAGTYVGDEMVGSENSYSKNVGQLRLDGIFNISNAICGYNPDRLFTLSVFAGPGLTIAKGNSSFEIQDGANNTWHKVRPAGADNKAGAYINGSVGLLGKFNVNQYLDIDVEARGELASSYLGYLASSRTVGGIYVGAGVTYTFGGKKFVSCGSKLDEEAINNEINKYRSELAQAQSDLANAKNALANVKPEVKEVTKEVQVAGPRAIFFKIGSARIDDYGKVNIELAAKILKANPDKKYKVAGYADKATGSASWNQKLSEKRAQAVYDALVAQGVNKDQLELVGFGGTENMFGKNYLNRVVILE
jgi:outer membrane protein OmpA-like peptidoglycan-associated protein